MAAAAVGEPASRSEAPILALAVPVDSAAWVRSAQFVVSAWAASERLARYAARPSAFWARLAPFVASADAVYQSAAVAQVELQAALPEVRVASARVSSPISDLPELSAAHTHSLADLMAGRQMQLLAI